MGVSFNSIFYFRQFNHHLSVIPACSRELMSCVGRLCKEYLYLYNSLPLIPTPPLIMAVNIGEAVGCPLPSKPPWFHSSLRVCGGHCVPLVGQQGPPEGGDDGEDAE